MARPEGVPADAQWDAEENEWAIGETAADGKTGTWCYWRPDGTLVEESQWCAGALHGMHRRYHDDGSLATVAEWADGKRREVIVYRAEAPSQDTRMGQLPESIRVMVQDFDAEGLFVRQRFYMAGDVEVDLDGEPIPPRPANVPEGAQHATRHGHWYSQSFIPGQGAELQSVGLHRFWATDGAFKQAEYYSADGELRAQVNPKDGGTSNPLIEAARVGDDQAVEECLALGLGASPGAALHATYEGLTDLARRLSDSDPAALQGDFVDPRAEPERRDGTSAEAVWVAGLGSWVLGALDPDTRVPTGTWRMWRSKPHLDEDQPIEVDFADGRPARRREYVPWRPEHLGKELHYGPDGEETLHRTYEDGVRSEETETLLDGTTARRRCHDDGSLSVERIGRDGHLVTETWFDEEGARTAQVTPTEALVKEKPVEWWRAFDASGAVIAEGAVRPGIEGRPVGRWRLFDADGAERATVKFKKLDVRRRGDLGQLAAAVHTWRTMPMPAALAGVDAVKWEKLDTFFGRDGSHFPFLLKGLAVPDDLAFGQALGGIWDEVLHQHTVSEIAGPTLRFMIALVAGMAPESVPAGLLEFILRVATRDSSLDATRQLQHLYDTVPADAKKPAKHFSKHDVEGAYHEIYTHLASAVPTWTRLAADIPGMSRECAIHLLAAAPGENAGTALRACLMAETQREGERDRSVLAALLLCLALHPSEAVDELLKPFLADADPLLRFCAALTWVRNGVTPAAPAVPILTEAIAGRSDLDEFGALFLAVGEAPTDAIGALSLLPPEQFRECLPEMCAALGAAGSLDSIDIAGALLDIVFPAEAYSDGAPLTDDQRTVIRTIADAETAWTFNVNLHEVLRFNGLPCDPDKLRALCEIPE